MVTKPDASLFIINTSNLAMQLRDICTPVMAGTQGNNSNSDYAAAHYSNGVRQPDGILGGCVHLDPPPPILGHVFPESIHQRDGPSQPRHRVCSLYKTSGSGRGQIGLLSQ